MSVVKGLVCALLLAALFWGAIEVAFLLGVATPMPVRWGAISAGAAGGGYASRYLSWGWLAGSLGGAVVGFYLPLMLMFVLSDIGYEALLPWLVLSTVTGLAMGGFSLDRIFRKRRKSCSSN